jgi:hypothetical protein
LRCNTIWSPKIRAVLSWAEACRKKQADSRVINEILISISFLVIGAIYNMNAKFRRKMVKVLNNDKGLLDLVKLLPIGLSHVLWGEEMI